MQIRPLLRVIAIASLIVACPAFTAADELETIAPLINDQTVAVTSVDLQRIDLASLQKQYLEPLLHSPSDRIEAAVAVDQVQEAIERLKAEGVRNAYLILTTARMPQLSFQHLDESLATSLPFLAIPGAKAETLEHWRAKFWNNAKRESQPDHKPPLKAGQIHGIAVVAFAELFDTLAAQPPQPRPQLAAALAAAGDEPVRLAIVPPAYFNRAAEEILLEPLPGMNQPLGQVLARGVRWSALSIDPRPDQFNFKLAIQSADTDSARNLADALRFAMAAVTNTLNESGEMQGMVGKALLTMLSTEVKDHRLELTLKGEQALALHQFVSATVNLARAGGDRRTSMNNLKHIALAIHNFDDKHKHLPEQSISDKNGKPLLSWRVAILPWIGEVKLFKEFHRNEPWDSEHNLKLIERMPIVLKSPDSSDSQPGRTRYLAPIGDNLAFSPNQPLQFKDFTDGTSKTMMIVEADPDHAVIWTKPDDHQIDLNHPLEGLATKKQMFSAAFADGHVETISGDIDPKVLRAYFTRNGGEAIKQ